MHETLRLRRSVDAVLLPTTVAVLLALVPLATAIAQTNDEESIRNAYAKFSFLCAVETVSDVAQGQDIGKPLDQRYLDDRLAKTVPSFTLTNFTSGPLSDIASKPWGDFVSPKSSAPRILFAGMSGRSYNDNGNSVFWRGAHVSWKAPNSDEPAELAMMARPVSKVIEIGTPYWSTTPVTFTRYVAFTVDASLDGQSSGQHKALFLFGTDTKGKPFAVEQDLITGTQASMWQLLITPSYPAGLLQSRLRNTPAVSAWIRANEMPASSCDSSKGDVCCSHGHCGISQSDLNRDLSAPLPLPKGGGQ